MAQKSNLDTIVRKEDKAKGQTEPKVNEARVEGPDHTAKPHVCPEPTVEQAFAVIEQSLKDGYPFTFDQMNLGIELSLRVMPESDQDWFREIATMNNIPIWQALWGQYRRCHENGLANAPVLDPGWSPEEIQPLVEQDCSMCQQSFHPKNAGQLYCSNACGAEAERRAKDLKQAS